MFDFFPETICENVFDPDSIHFAERTCEKVEYFNKLEKKAIVFRDKKKIKYRKQT